RLDHLSGDDYTVGIVRTGRTEQEAISPTFALCGAKAAMNKLQSVNPTCRTEGIEGPARSIYCIANHKSDATVFAAWIRIMLSQDSQCKRFVSVQLDGIDDEFLGDLPQTTAPLG